MEKINDVLPQVADDIDKLFSDSESEKSTCSFGIEDLNDLTGGLRPGEVTLLCSTTKLILTSFAAKVAIANTLNNENPILIFSTSNKSSAFCKLALTNFSLLDLNKFYVGNFLDDDWQDLTDALARINQTALHLKNLPEQTSIQIEEEVNKHMENAIKDSKRVQLVIVDNLETLGRTTPVSNLLDSQFQSGEDMRRLSSLARNLNVPVLVLTGLQKQKEKMYDKFYSLKEIPSDLLPFATNIFFLNHESAEQEVHIIVAQSSAGKLGKVKCYENGSALVNTPIQSQL